MSRLVDQRTVVRHEGGAAERRVEALAVEEPLELRIGDWSMVTMRTPGHDFELALGFLVGEGVARCSADVRSLRYCTGKDADGRQTYNVLDAVLADGLAAPSARAAGSTTGTAACGTCGKDRIESVRTTGAWEVSSDPATVPSSSLAALPGRLRAEQDVFERTGGLHAAGLFGPDGELRCVREDVGRHNAVDKVVGWALRGDLLPLRGHVLQVSGRASFELAQKAVMAGIPVLSAVSAPSSLAVSLAEEAGLTLAGFVRHGALNVYARPDRITPG